MLLKRRAHRPVELGPTAVTQRQKVLCLPSPLGPASGYGVALDSRVRVALPNEPRTIAHLPSRQLRTQLLKPFVAAPVQWPYSAPVHIHRSITAPFTEPRTTATNPGPVFPSAVTRQIETTSVAFQVPPHPQVSRSTTDSDIRTGAIRHHLRQHCASCYTNTLFLMMLFFSLQIRKHIVT